MNNLFKNDRSLPTPNIVGTGTQLNGEVQCDGDFRVDGELHATVNIKGCLIVGATGVIVGTITAKSIEIAGHVNASMLIEDYTMLKSTSKVTTIELKTSKLIIEPGAIFNGKCEMIEKEGKKK